MGDSCIELLLALERRGDETVEPCPLLDIDEEMAGGCGYLLLVTW